MKLCSKCKTVEIPKPGYCRECRREYLRQYYAANREKIAARMRAYRARKKAK